MNSLVRKVVATALVLATAPAAALACDDERGERNVDVTPDRHAPPVQYVPQAYYVSPDRYAPPDPWAPAAVSTPPAQYPQPARYAPPAPPCRTGCDFPWRDDRLDRGYPVPDRSGWQDGGRPWRDGSWRWRELAELRADMRDLDARRAGFHARFGWHPGKVRRFERWYAFRRAELERRYRELQSVAWR